MALPAIDNFAGVSGDPVSANWTATRGSFQINGSNAVRSSAGSGTESLMYWNADTFSNDQYAIASLVSGSLTTAGVCVRVSGQDCYSVMVYDGGGSGNFALNRFSNGSYTTVHAFTETWTNGNTIKLSISGSTLSVEMDSGSGFVPIGGGSFTDSTFATGAPGIFGYDSSSSIGAFEGGNVGGGGGGPAPGPILGLPMGAW